MGRAARSLCLQPSTEGDPTAVLIPSMAFHAGLGSLTRFYPVSCCPRERMKQLHTRGGFHGHGAAKRGAYSPPVHLALGT